MNGMHVNSPWKNQSRLYVMPYRGWGNSRVLYFTGAVVRGRGIVQPLQENSIWSNFRATARRFLNKSVPGKRVVIRFYGREKLAITDKRGVFSGSMNIEDLPIRALYWHPYTVKLRDEKGVLVTATGEALIRNFTHSRYGIISDIDDTFLVTYATHAIKKVLLTIFYNAATRRAFRGVSNFYQALHQEKQKGVINPFFFVSSSAWNLYDFVEDFCYFNRIPKGPFLLYQRHYKGWKFWKAQIGDHSHKLVKCRNILQTYPGLSFILIGDSGQADVSIYSRLHREFPNRIKMIYIRNVSDKKRIRRLHRMAVQMGVPEKKIFFGYFSGKLYHHAREQGYIQD